MTNKGTQLIETPRLTLRRFELADAPAMFSNWATDPQTTKYLRWDPYKNVSDVTEYLSGIITLYSNPMTYIWVIEVRETGEIIGSINLHDVSERNDCVELGYCMGSRWWNKGYMTESLRAVINFAFAELNVHKVAASYDEENVASGRVMMKNKMIYEGRLRKHVRRRDGTFADLLCYGILRDEWDAMQA